MTLQLKIIKGFILSLIDLMENNWLNPLSPDESDLVGMSTGTVAPPAVVNDLLRALEVGEEAYQTFKQTRLDDDPPSVKFHDKMTKQSLKTFSTIGTNTARTKGQNVVLKADRNLFSQMILVAESRSVNMKDVLAHPLGPLPWALANADGSLRKTNKAALAREIEKTVSPAEAIPTPSTCIIDGMGLVQRMNGNKKHLHNWQSLYWPWYCMWVERVVGLMLSLTYAASRPSTILKELIDLQAQLFSTHVWQGDTTYSSGENS